jgi:hypothetical protein
VLTVEYSFEEIEGSPSPTALPTDIGMEYHPRWGSKKVYVCPRGVYVHMGKPGACGRQCMKAQGDADAVYDEEPVMRVLVVEKRTVLTCRPV